MAKDRSLVRASDIGAWAYCRRAWYLAQVRKVDHSRPDSLRQGTQAHTRHGQKVRHAGQMQRIGRGLIVAGVVLVGLLILWSLWQSSLLGTGSL
jgi:hypothetical protein